MNDSEIVNQLNQRLGSVFDDYRGLYFFGSRIKNTFKPDSDYDVVLIFDSLSYEKELKIAGIIGRLEYEKDIFVDYKTLTSSGEKSIVFIRKKVNPVFIMESVDKGIFYARF